MRQPTRSTLRRAPGHRDPGPRRAVPRDADPGAARRGPAGTLVGTVAGLASGAALYWRRLHPERVMLVTLAGGLTIQLIFPDGMAASDAIAIGHLPGAAAGPSPAVAALVVAGWLAVFLGGAWTLFERRDA